MIYTVTVGVALQRPPKIDEYRKIVVQADTDTDALLLACQIATCTSIMAVTAKITNLVL